MALTATCRGRDKGRRKTKARYNVAPGRRLTPEAEVSHKTPLSLLYYSSYKYAQKWLRVSPRLDLGNSRWAKKVSRWAKNAQKCAKHTVRLAWRSRSARSSSLLRLVACEGILERLISALISTPVSYLDEATDSPANKRNKGLFENHLVQCCIK